MVVLSAWCWLILPWYIFVSSFKNSPKYMCGNRLRAHLKSLRKSDANIETLHTWLSSRLQDRFKERHTNSDENDSRIVDLLEKMFEEVGTINIKTSDTKQQRPNVDCDTKEQIGQEFKQRVSSDIRRLRDVDQALKVMESMFVQKCSTSELNYFGSRCISSLGAKRLPKDLSRVLKFLETVSGSGPDPHTYSSLMTVYIK